MTSYTTLPDATIAQDQPVTQAVGRALRDNPLAIAEGDPSAPKISSNNAFDDGIIGAEKLQSGSTEESWVSERYAGVGPGDIGAYAMVRVASGFSVTPWFAGASTTGANLRVVKFDTSGNTTDATTPGGIWKNMTATVNNGAVIMVIRVS
jgi:hypothetical protein